MPEMGLRLTSGEPRALQRNMDSGRLNSRFLARIVHVGCIASRVGVVRVRADTSWVRPTRHLWTRSKQPWVTFAEG